MQLNTQLKCIQEIEQVADKLTTWERDFINSVTKTANSKNNKLSLKQIEILGRIHRRLTKC